MQLISAQAADRSILGLPPAPPAAAAGAPLPAAFPAHPASLPIKTKAEELSEPPPYKPLDHHSQNFDSAAHPAAISLKRAAHGWRITGEGYVGITHELAIYWMVKSLEQDGLLRSRPEPSSTARPAMGNAPAVLSGLEAYALLRQALSAVQAGQLQVAPGAGDDCAAALAEWKQSAERVFWQHVHVAQKRRERHA